MDASFSHRLPGQHVYSGVLFFGYSPPDILDAVKDFNVRDDDVFIITYPKAGTVILKYYKLNATMFILRLQDENFR